MQFDALREWVVGTLGDPAGYLSGYEQQGVPVLHRVHERFADTIAAAERRLADPARAPLVVLAHSLGGVVVTNYLWNLERAAGEVGTSLMSTMHAGARETARRPFGESPMQRLETLAGLVTFGCNIPLFLPPGGRYECVRFPRPGLPAHLKAAARWLNVYDPWDVLGYPLNDLWDEAHGTVDPGRRPGGGDSGDFDDAAVAHALLDGWRVPVDGRAGSEARAGGGARLRPPAPSGDGANSIARNRTLDLVGLCTEHGPRPVSRYVLPERIGSGSPSAGQPGGT